MKRTIFWALIIMLLSAQSCQELDQLTQFDLPYTFEASLPGSVPVDDPFTITTPPIATELEDRLADFNTTPDLIEEVLLKEMNLKVVAPDSQGMDFLSSIEIWLNAAGQTENKIAFREMIPDTVGQVLSLETLPVDVKPYLLADSMQFKIVFQTDALITNPVDLEIESIFRIDAKILGL